MTTFYYDVVVMGMELGPLAAGALLAKRGFRVLVVGQNGASDRYPCFDYQFQFRPFKLTGSESRAFTSLVDELGISQFTGQAVRFKDPAFQLIAPRTRIDVSHTVEDTKREVQRELPEEAVSFEEALENVGRVSGEVGKLLTGEFVLPPESFFERREYSRIEVQNPFRVQSFFNAKFEGAALPEIFDLPLRFETAGAAPVPPLVRYRQLGNWLFDCASFVEGRDGLRRLLLEQVVGQGGDAHPGQQITEIVVKKGRLSGVSLAGKNESVGCQVILTSLTPSEISSYIQPASWTRRFQDAVADCPPPMRGYALNLGVEKEVVPEGLADTAFLTNGPGLGEQLLRIEKIPQKDETRAALHVACIVPRGDEPAIETGALRDALLDRIRALVPFLDNALEVIHSPFDGFGPIDLKGGAKGPAPPVPHKEEVTKWLLRPPPQAGPLGVGNLPHRTGIKGLLLAGDQVVSGLGLEGELLAAWGAARIAGKMDPRRERLLRSMRSKVEM